MSWMNKAAELAQGALQKHNQSTAGADANNTGGQQSSGSFSDMTGMLQKMVSSHNTGGAGQGTDWSNLSGLMTHFVSSGDSASAVAQNAKTGTAEAPPVNTDVINKLLAAFQSHTGSTFTGNAGEYEQLAAFAQKMTGKSIPTPILKKMVEWKMKQMT